MRKRSLRSNSRWADRVLFIDEGCLTLDGPIKEFAAGKPLDVRFREMSGAETS